MLAAISGTIRGVLKKQDLQESLEAITRRAAWPSPWQLETSEWRQTRGGVRLRRWTGSVKHLNTTRASGGRRLGIWWRGYGGATGRWCVWLQQWAAGRFRRWQGVVRQMVDCRRRTLVGQLTLSVARATREPWSRVKNDLRLESTGGARQPQRETADLEPAPKTSS